MAVLLSWCADTFVFTGRDEGVSTLVTFDRITDSDYYRQMN